VEREQKEIYELEDIEVDRVDAVDRPATGRRWLIMKSEEEDENAAIAKELEERVAEVLEALANDAQGRGGLPLSEAALSALNRLATLYGLQQPFSSAPAEAAAEASLVQGAEADSAAEAASEPVAVAAEAGEQETDEQKVSAESQEGYGYPAPSYPNPDIWSAILEELKAIRALLEKGAVAKSQPAQVASRQPEPEARVRQPQVRRWGEGLFADVLFGS
jgi:hypothetical protein